MDPDGRRWHLVACFAAFGCLGLQVALLTPIYLLANQPEAYDTDLAVVLARGLSVAGMAAFVAENRTYKLHSSSMSQYERYGKSLREPVVALRPS